MQAPRPRTPSHGFKTFFLRGLAVLLPSVLTLWLLVKAYQFVDSSIAAPINSWVRLGTVQLDRRYPWILDEFQPTPGEVADAIAAMPAGRRPVSADAVAMQLREDGFREWWEQTWYLNLVGLLIAVVAVYTAGRLLGGFVGRRIYRRLEGLLTSVPVVKHIYPHIKQVVDFVLSDERPITFNRVVAVQYPRQGIWSIGLVTGEGMRPLRGSIDDPITLFIPSSPTPFTGYTVTVPRGETIELPLSIDEALRFVVTAGVLQPTRDGGPALPEESAAAGPPQSGP
jgi:uncharacterized membrane protein